MIKIINETDKLDISKLKVPFVITFDRHEQKDVCYMVYKDYNNYYMLINMNGVNGTPGHNYSDKFDSIQTVIDAYKTHDNFKIYDIEMNLIEIK